MQVAQIFAWLDKLAGDKLMLSTSLQTQPEKALFFAKDTERLILPDNIQVGVCGIYTSQGQSGISGTAVFVSVLKAL